MSSLESVKRKQELWAVRRGIELGGPFRWSANRAESERGRKSWTYTLTENLFEPLLPEVREEIESGDGGELVANSPGEGNMYALHSSSALACNLFHYWRSRRAIEPIARACAIPSSDCVSLRFEVQHQIDRRFRRAPNLDAEIAYSPSDRWRATGIECKFCEPFSGYEHAGLAARYLEISGCWKAYPALKALATEISPADKTYKRFHAAQVIKHILGLSRTYGAGQFRLLYVFYDVAGPDGDEHRDEIERFRRVVLKDGIHFQAETYQGIIRRLAQSESKSHPEYISYMTERYL